MKRIKRAALGILAGALVGTGAVTGVMAFTPVQANAEAPDYMPSKNIMTPTKLEYNKSYKKNIRGDKDGSYYYFTTDSSSKPYSIEIFNDVDSKNSIQVKCYEMDADNSNQSDVFGSQWDYGIGINVNDRYKKTLEVGTEKGMLKPNCKYMIRVGGLHSYYYLNPIYDDENFIVHFKIGHESAPTFSDVKKSDWYYAPVVWAASNNIVTGTNGKFYPASSCTREQAVTFLWRMAGKPEPKSMVSKFSDVKDKNRYSYKAIMWGTENGIITGTNGKFYPTGTCTREQIVTIIWRLAGKPEPINKNSKFKDITNKNRYSYKAVMWAHENGITTGTNGKFYPTGQCKRREIVTFIYRYKN